MSEVQTALDLGAAPPRPRRPQEPIVRTAQIEVEGPWTYRWLMHRAWGPGKKTIFWGMLNPSDADGKRDDPTTWRVIEFSYAWGFDSVIIGNIYPIVSAHPSKMRAWRKTWDWETYQNNGMRPWSMDRSTWSAFHHSMAVISKAVAGDMTFVAAWGTGVPPADVEQFVNGVRFDCDDEEHGLLRLNVDWHCLGKTADGSPIHPLARGKNRVPNDAKLKLWKRAQSVDLEDF